MTLDAMDWVWRQARSRGNARLALLAVADATTGPEATAPMGTAEFMRRLGGVPKSTALDAIARAVEAGELAVEEPAAGRRPAVYRLPGAVDYTAVCGPNFRPQTTGSGLESRPQTAPTEPLRSDSQTTNGLRSDSQTTNADSCGRESRPQTLWDEDPEKCATRTRASFKAFERVSERESVRADAIPSAVVPDFARPLVDKITAAEVYPQWNLTPGEWFQVDAMIKRSGADMLAAVAVRAAAKRDVSHARYFLRAWQSLPPAPTAGTVPAAPAGPGADVIPFRDRQQQATDDLFDRAMARAQARMAQEATQ